MNFIWYQQRKILATEIFFVHGYLQLARVRVQSSQADSSKWSFFEDLVGMEGLLLKDWLAFIFWNPRDTRVVPGLPQYMEMPSN